MGKLTDRSVKTADPGRHVDSDGLCLVVSRSGRRKWVLRYQRKGKRRDLGLGSYPTITLAKARERALAARRMIAEGVDPIDQKRADERAAKPLPTFGDIAELVIADAQAKSVNAKVRYQWERHLGPAYCGPLLDRPVNEITTLDVVSVLAPVWREKPEVARKLYPAIRRVFERARIVLRDKHGVAMPDNPARWADLKAMQFEAPSRLSRGSHPALAYKEMPAFLADLRAREAIAARALEFLILTNVRTDAVLKATWEQFDLDPAGGVWTIPLTSLKDRAHRTESFRVPLSARAVEIVRQMETTRISEFIFPGPAEMKPMSNMAMLTLLKRMNGGDAPKWVDPKDGRPITAHGFRASFKTWAEETAIFPHAIVEEAMGHQVGGQVERAYRRTDVLKQRRKLMDAWAAHCEPRGDAGRIVAFKRSGASAA